MKKLSIILFVLLPFWDNTGNTFPGTGTNDAGIGATAWVTPENIVSDNTTDATCNAGASSQYLVASNFGFTLPTSPIAAVVKGVTVRIEGSESSAGTEVVSAQLQDAGGALFGNVKTNTFSGTGKTVYTYGAANDLWGLTNPWQLTPAITNDIDFGVRFWYTTAHNVAVDYVTIAIEYKIGTSTFFQMFSSKPKK